MCPQRVHLFMFQGWLAPHPPTLPYFSTEDQHTDAPKLMVLVSLCWNMLEKYMIFNSRLTTNETLVQISYCSNPWFAMNEQGLSQDVHCQLTPCFSPVLCLQSSVLCRTVSTGTVPHPGLQFRFDGSLQSKNCGSDNTAISGLPCGVEFWEWEGGVVQCTSVSSCLSTAAHSW